MGTHGWWDALTIITAESAHFEMMDSVAELDMQGHSEYQISKKLDIPRKEVKKLLGEYRDILVNDAEARDMARDHLNMMVKHYDSLIRKFYELLDEIDMLNFSHQVAAQKNATIKSIAELEAKRLDALQKAGLLESHELGDELAEMEERQEVILDILQNDLCPQCQRETASKLTRLLGNIPSAEYDVEVIHEQ